MLCANAQRSNKRSLGGAAICLAVTLLLTGSSPPRTEDAVLKFGIGVHIEPFGAQVSQIALNAGASPIGAGRNRMDYHRRPDFERHVDDLMQLADIVESHGGVLTVQAQTPFTASAVAFDHPILSALEQRGHEIGLHFHEDAHLGQGAEALSPTVWAAVMTEEIERIHAAGVVGSIRYWSGGNLYPDLYEAATAAGLTIHSDWKNPGTQSTPDLLTGIHPWRPSAGTTGEDVLAFARHDPEGTIVFLPGGQFDTALFQSKQQIKEEGGLAAWLDVIEDALQASLENVHPDRVNVFHFTAHPGEFIGRPDAPYEALDRFLSEVVDPLVAAGWIEWATFSEMDEAYASWEETHPGIDPRTPTR